jgi:hypothetical protein
MVHKRRNMSTIMNHQIKNWLETKPRGARMILQEVLAQIRKKVKKPKKEIRMMKMIIIMIKI